MHDSQFEGLPLTPRAPATTAWVWWWLPAGWGDSAWTGPGLSSSPLPSLSSSDSEVEWTKRISALPWRSFSKLKIDWEYKHPRSLQIHLWQYYGSNKSLGVCEIWRQLPVEEDDSVLSDSSFLFSGWDSEIIWRKEICQQNYVCRTYTRQTPLHWWENDYVQPGAPLWNMEMWLIL